MRYQTTTLSYDTRVRIFWTLAAVSVAAIGLYMYSVNAAVQNTLARKALETQADILSSKIADAQFAYIADIQKIDLDSVHASGFADASDPLYISREPVLSLAR